MVGDFIFFLEPDKFMSTTGTPCCGQLPPVGPCDWTLTLTRFYSHEDLSDHLTKFHLTVPTFGVTIHPTRTKNPFLPLSLLVCVSISHPTYFLTILLTHLCRH